MFSGLLVFTISILLWKTQQSQSLQRQRLDSHQMLLSIDNQEIQVRTRLYLISTNEDQGFKINFQLTDNVEFRGQIMAVHG